MNSAITGVNGGLIVVSADDPSMHSSQNEQDSRFYGKFAMIPILEPSNQQEAYNMAYTGFELSEKLGVPVLLRITTRLSHSRSGVEKQQSKTQRELSLPEDLKQFILLPANARGRYANLVKSQPALKPLQKIQSLMNYSLERIKSLELSHVASHTIILWKIFGIKNRNTRY